MTEPIPQDLLTRLQGLIAARMGLHFPVKRLNDLERKVAGASEELGFQDPVRCAEWLVESLLTADQVAALAQHLTVGETYFLRGQSLFTILREEVLPGLISARRGRDQRLRIWSAGCASGEEPYSIAILLDQLLPDRREWEISLLATDINRRALQQAVAGIYKKWSFRSTPDWLRDKYFTQVGSGRFQIASHIREMVRFFPINLVQSDFPAHANGLHDMDLIFCRNVLMYFDAPSQGQVVERLYKTLADDGWLIVSPSEASHELFARYEAVHRPGAILFRKAEGQTGWEKRSALPSDGHIDPEPNFFAPLDQDRDLAGEAFLSQSVTWEALLPTDTSPLDQQHPHPPPEPDPAGAETNSDPAPLLVARELVEAQRGEDALQYIEKHGLDHDPEGMFLVARVLANRGRLAEAMSWCEKALAADKLNPACRYLQAVILQELGQPRAAVIALKKTLYLDPEYIPAHLSLGNMLLAEQKAVEARKSFLNARELLKRMPPEAVVPESDGMTAQGLNEMLEAIVHEGVQIHDH